MPTSLRLALSALLFAVALPVAGCGGTPSAPVPSASAGPGVGFRGGDCNGVTDADVNKAVGSSMYTKALVGDAGCFWQENSVFGTVGMGMGISTWWYRGSDMDTERQLERHAGRTLVELSVDGNKGFKAHDANACSIYVAKDGDVITWSIQTMNPASLPDLCSIVDHLAQLSQDRVN